MFDGYSPKQHKIDDIVIQTDSIKSDNEQYTNTDGNSLTSTVNLIQLNQINDIIQDLANKCNMLVQSANQQLECGNVNQPYMGNSSYYSDVVSEDVKRNLK